MENSIKIGSFLKASREEKNLTLEQVVSKTKININVLRDLESDQIDKLPNITYVRGFVKNYAKAVGIDPEEAKRLLEIAYKEDESPLEEVSQTIESASQNQNSKDESNIGMSPDEAQEIKENIISFIQSMFKKKYLIPLFALIIASLIIKSILSWVGTLVNEPGKQSTEEGPKETQVVTDIAEVQSTQNRQTIPTPSDEPREIVSTPIKTIEVIAPVSSKTKVEEAKEVKKPEANKKETEVLAPGELPYRKFSRAPLKTFTVVDNSPEALNTRLLPLNIKNSAIEGKQNVYIVAESGDTWLSYKVDDQPIKRYVLKKNRRLFIKGDRILVFIGNYNITKVFYNNQFITAKTNTGVKSLIFPAEAAKDLVLPLFPSYKGVPYESKVYIERMKAAPKS